MSPPLRCSSPRIVPLSPCGILTSENGARNGIDFFNKRRELLNEQRDFRPFSPKTSQRLEFESFPYSIWGFPLSSSPRRVRMTNHFYWKDSFLLIRRVVLPETPNGLLLPPGTPIESQ